MRAYVARWKAQVPPPCSRGRCVQVFLSLPCVLGRAGIISAVNIDLTEREQEQLRKSADTVCAVQRKLQQFGAA